MKAISKEALDFLNLITTPPDKIVWWAAVPRMSRSAGHAFRGKEELSVCGRVRAVDATESRGPGLYPSCPRCIEVLDGKGPSEP